MDENLLGGGGGAYAGSPPTNVRPCIHNAMHISIIIT